MELAPIFPAFVVVVMFPLVGVFIGTCKSLITGDIMTKRELSTWLPNHGSDVRYLAGWARNIL